MLDHQPSGSNSNQQSSLVNTQTSLMSSNATTPNTTKNISIILPGDKKPKMIGSGKKPDIKADVVSGLEKNLYWSNLLI